MQLQWTIDMSTTDVCADERSWCGQCPHPPHKGLCLIRTDLENSPNQRCACTWQTSPTIVDRRELSDEEFLRSRRAAFKAELAVAYTCVEAGAIAVTVPEYRIRPSFEKRGMYRDHGDLLVSWGPGHETHYEIKQRDLSFTSRDDYPWRTVLVDEVANLDSKNPRPHAYFICNAALDAALYVAIGKSVPLVVIKRFDRRYNQEIDFYAVPLEHTKLIPLTWKTI